MIRSMVLVLLAVGVGAVILGIALGVWIWRVQEQIVFQPPSPPYPDGRAARRLDLRADDGQPLFAYLVGDPAGNGLVIVFHGNADLAGWQLPWATTLSRRTGRAVLVAEFRGYSGLPGAPTYDGARLDARAVYTAARETLGVPAERIALYGHSLGSAIAAELARDVRPEVLVLVSPMTSVRDMAHRVSPVAGLLFHFGLARVHYDTEALVSTLDTPVWVAHGARDDVMPVVMGRRVHETAKIKGELLVLDSAAHNDVSNLGGERYWAWMNRALQSADVRR